jgi:hypothetical protein
MTQHYIYLGDRLTDPLLKGSRCQAIKRTDGNRAAERCIRGRNGNMLVQFDNGRVANVLGRLLRKTV